MVFLGKEWVVFCVNQKELEKLRQLSSALSASAQQAERLQQINFAALEQIRAAALPSSVTQIVLDATMQQMKLIESLPADLLRRVPPIELQQSLHRQWQIILKIMESYPTPALAALRQAILQNDYLGGMQHFSTALQGNVIEAPNVAFLRKAPFLTESMGDLIPKRVVGISKTIHTQAADRLANSDNISLKVDDKVFFDEANPENTANVLETNIICSSLEVLGGISEQEMLDFLNRLATIPSFGSEHPVGRKISESIRSWEDRISFDYPHYYHGREFPKDGCPYTSQQLERAPFGVTLHGRFNHPGTSHYYFSNEKRGAVLEVRKHSKGGTKIAIAKITPVQKINMVDLSSEVKKQNKFLEYCRFSPVHGDYSNMKREYLIPCFVADCCKLHGLDGIKYYGSKEYANYVTWTEGHFKCVGIETEDDSLSK